MDVEAQLRKLEEFIYVNRMSRKDFAKRLDVSAKHFYGVLKGRYKVSKKLARRIEDQTLKKISYKSLIGEVRPKR